MLKEESQILVEIVKLNYRILLFSMKFNDYYITILGKIKLLYLLKFKVKIGIDCFIGTLYEKNTYLSLTCY